MSLARLLSLFKKKRDSPSPPKADECCLCREPLSGRVAQDAWGNSAHLTHRISFCGSCERILSPYSSGGAYQYSDGRLICGFCKKIAVTDSVEANRGRRKVLDLLEKAGFLGIPKNVKIVLAHPRSLSAHARGRPTSGLTLTHFHFNNYKRSGTTHQIGILHGLPKVEFEAVMAHELLHVWQHENGIHFSPMYAEGLCELGGFLVYSEDSSDLARHFLEKMKRNPDPVYGNGFRLMLEKLKKVGWKALIDEILRNKRGFEGRILSKMFPKN
ncbi:MAG: hypothetical protein U1F57_03785 [bacterium]